MTTVSMRTLSRETSRVVDDLGSQPSGVLVTRDGEPVARLVPVSVIEQEMYRALLAQGIDPDSPPEVDPALVPLSPPDDGGPTASEWLQRDRDSQYEDDAPDQDSTDVHHS